MIASSRTRNAQFWLYALAFGLALLLRLLRLGFWPLTEAEAGPALQAFDLLKGVQPALGPQPAYALLTALVFFVAQASDLAARLIPALFGAALVLTPYFFRDRLGEKPAWVLAFLLAFDPGLLALSRLAGSPVMALSALVLAWGLWRANRFSAAGASLGLALLCGPQFWPGVLGLLIAAGLSRNLADAQTPAVDRASALRALAYAAGTYLVLGSFFLLAPGGLSGGAQSLIVYLGGWIDFSDVPAWRLLLALAVYQFPALILAGIALVRGLWQRQTLEMSLGAWLLVSLTLALAYPSRQVADLAWVLIPLGALAALEVSRHLGALIEHPWETYGMLAVTAIILFFCGINLTNLALVPMDAQAMSLRWVLLAVSLALLALSVGMVAYGWSPAVARQGAAWGVLLVFSIYTLSAGMAAAGLRTYRTVELWSPGMNIEQAHSLAGQLGEISHWRIGPNLAPLDVTVSGLDSAALRWTLRNWNASFIPSLDITASPSVLITPAQADSPALQAGYRGQDMIWRTAPLWNQLPASDWRHWIALHSLPQEQESIILWVRSDIFIDSQNNMP